MVCVKIPPASCTEGANKSNIFSFFSKSKRHVVIISLSLNMPSARNRIKRGTGLRTLGILTTMFLKVYDGVGAIIFTDRVLMGLETFSDTDRISAEYKYFSSPDSRIYNILSANFSWVTTVFSLPSMMKYPPTSFKHSPMVWRISLGNPLNTQ